MTQDQVSDLGTQDNSQDLSQDMSPEISQDIPQDIPQNMPQDIPSPADILQEAQVFLEEYHASNVKRYHHPSGHYLCDDSLLVTVAAPTQGRNLAYRLMDELKKRYHLTPYATEGEKEGEWILLDYSAFIIHFFLPEVREYYQLDKFLGSNHQRSASSPHHDS